MKINLIQFKRFEKQIVLKKYKGKEEEEYRKDQKLLEYLFHGEMKGFLR